MTTENNTDYLKFSIMTSTLKAKKRDTYYAASHKWQAEVTLCIFSTEEEKGKQDAVFGLGSTKTEAIIDAMNTAARRGQRLTNK